MCANTVKNYQGYLISLLHDRHIQYACQLAAKENIDDISRKNIPQSTLQQVPTDNATA
jgi:hypothetical protein